MSLSFIRTVKSRRLRWTGHVAGMWKNRNTYRILVGEPLGNVHIWRPRKKREDNIKMDIWKVGCVDCRWIELAQDRSNWRALVFSVLNLWVLLL